jgi:hypothetical protein
MPEIPEIPMSEMPEITVPEIPEIPAEPLDPKPLEASGDSHTIIKPLLPDNSELNTPEFSPISYESFDVTRNISDWEDLDDIIETMDTFENYM